MFNRARLKLTFWYVFIIMVISFFFSVVIYRGVLDEVERFRQIQRTRIERRIQDIIEFEQLFQPDLTPPTSQADLDLVNETRLRITIILFLINGTIFIFSTGLSYFLAGKTLQPIQNMLDEQNRFISDASHELKTPLTSLKTAIEVNLRDKKMTLENAKELIARNLEDVNKLQYLSESLLQLAQYERLILKPKMKSISLANIVKKALHTTEPLIIHKNITVKNEVKEIIIQADPYSLHDLLVILIDNAIKYSNPKTTIALLSRKTTDQMVTVSVRDQGIGIDKKDLPHIFDRFFRSDKTRSSTKENGYGLGLSIAKKIVERHQGSIKVHSIPGKGSTFTIQLPIHQKIS